MRERETNFLARLRNIFIQKALSLSLARAPG